jgi:hypothetical protein
VFGLVSLLSVLGLIGPAATPAAPPRVTYTYSIQVAQPTGDDGRLFPFFVHRAYSDPRGWSENGQIAFKQVPTGGDYTVWLVPADRMTSFGGGCTDTFSCRSGRNVVINDTRWRTGSVDPAWKLSLADYHLMVINHETGHWLGLGHTHCAGPDEPADLMQQQSKSLEGCAPTVWPSKVERTIVTTARGLTAPSS